MVGVPIGADPDPPQRQICEATQYLEPVYGRGPASVLKHTGSHCPAASLQETAGSRIPFPPPAKGRPDSQTLPFARDTYFFVAGLLESILFKLAKKLDLP